MNHLILASEIAVGGDGLIHALLMVLIIGICLGIVYAVGRWFIQKLAAPPIAMTIWNGFFILVVAILVINFLLSLGGHGFISY